MKNAFVLVVLLLGCLTLSAQSLNNNLVVNYSFEDPTLANTDLKLSENIDKVKGWSSPNNGSPRLFTTTKQGYIYDAYGASWNFKARSGKHVAGIDVYGSESERDYVQGKLVRPLTVGKKYYFSFFVHYHCEGANNIGIVFLPNAIKKTSEGLMKLTPATYQREVTPYDKKNTWTMVQDSFVAQMPLQSFLIGNFFSDEETEIETKGYGHHFAYIDDIQVWEAKDKEMLALPVSAVEVQEEWKKNIEKADLIPDDLVAKGGTAFSVQELGDLSFTKNSANLNQSSLEILDKVFEEMQKYPELNIRIMGYASIEGSESANLQISEKRAMSAFDYLSKKGIAVNRVELVAVGEGISLYPNDLKKSKQFDRRVQIERFVRR